MSTALSFDTIDDVRTGFHRISTSTEFDHAASVVEAYQKRHNPVFARYDAGRFVPVEVFKYARVASFPPEATTVVFRSSGTGQADRRAEHHVRDIEVYGRSALAGFQYAFGDGPFVLVAHLPAYAPDSSLVWMLQHLIREAGAPGSRVISDARNDIMEAARVASFEQPLLLFGAAFGLMDIVERDRVSLPAGSLVVETGGMKTHRRTARRQELHEALSEGFGVPLASIHSEYGMCELLSQCYTTRGGAPRVASPLRANEWFHAPPWMRLDVHRADVPDAPCADGEEGVLVVTDLANMFSLSFIRTQDRAVRRGSRVTILGREEGAQLRGCNFLFENDS